MNFKLIFVIAILIFSCNAPQKKVALNLDESLQKLHLVDLEGNQVDLKNYLQKPLLINYWATWCKPCKMEFPYFQKFIEKHQKKINVLMISDESIPKINQFKSSNNYNFVYLKSNKKLRSLHINIIPTSVYYNAKGEHLEGIQGSVDLKILEDMVEYHR